MSNTESTPTSSSEVLERPQNPTPAEVLQYRNKRIAQEAADEAYLRVINYIPGSKDRISEKMGDVFSSHRSPEVCAELGLPPEASDDDVFAAALQVEINALCDTLDLPHTATNAEIEAALRAYSTPL